MGPRGLGWKRQRTVPSETSQQGAAWPTTEGASTREAGEKPRKPFQERKRVCAGWGQAGTRHPGKESPDRLWLVKS